MTDELATLRAKLKASKGRPGYAARTAAIEGEIARIESEQAQERLLNPEGGV